MHILQTPASKQLSFKCIARQPERWPGMLNILPESFADFKLKIWVKKKWNQRFSDVEDNKHFSIHTNKMARTPTHTENMV